MSRLRVLIGGLQTSVQDLGRRGFQAFGVPVSGALDPISLRLGNALVGNSEGMGALELRMAGPTLRVEEGKVRVALAGTGAALLVERANGAQEEWVSWRAVDLDEGDVVSVPATPDTAVAYLAFAGGVDVPDVLGSRSTLLRGGFGGHEGRAVQEDDELTLGEAAIGRALTVLAQPPMLPVGTLRVVAGPQEEAFTLEALEDLQSEPFRVSTQSDRMGLRLEGPVLRHVKGADIVSDAIATGSIQVPGSGQPILLLADHQTTGGYAKIATVISADIPAAGRLLPNSEVRFRVVSVEEAVAGARIAEERVAYLRGAVIPVREGARL
jgi:UPF0271 protein